MIIKENESARIKETEELKQRVDKLMENETAHNKTIQDLQTEICDKNKVN